MTWTGAGFWGAEKPEAVPAAVPTPEPRPEAVHRFEDWPADWTADLSSWRKLRARIGRAVVRFGYWIGGHGRYVL